MSGPRYFLEDEPALAGLLDGFLAELASDLERQPFHGEVAALVLGGGYGRGEGGVFRAVDAGPAELYNDLEFFMFTERRASAPALTVWCHRWEKLGTARLGIDVEFKCLPAATLQTAAPTMFYFDLLQGHRMVWGRRSVLADAPATLRNPAAIPLSEPVRLLFNRGSGLLFARWRLEEHPEDASGFVERNHAKMRLALADAVLAAAGRHDGRCEKRAERIQAGRFFQPAEFLRLQQWHAEGVEFKLRPRHRHPGAAVLLAENKALTAAWLDVFLWLERRRLNQTLVAAPDYVNFPGRIFSGTASTKNFILHLRDRLRRGAALPRWTDYPRGTLQRALVAAQCPGGGEQIAAQLIEATPANWRAEYRRWWSFYN